MQKFSRRLLGGIAAACMLLSLAPASAFAVEPEDDTVVDGTPTTSEQSTTPDTTPEPAADSVDAAETQAEGYVAKIGDTEYATLDEAVAAAADGATIELLGDATTAGMNLSRNLTIQAAEGLADKPTITFTQYGIAL